MIKKILTKINQNTPKSKIFGKSKHNYIAHNYFKLMVRIVKYHFN